MIATLGLPFYLTFKGLIIHWDPSLTRSQNHGPRVYILHGMATHGLLLTFEDYVFHIGSTTVKKFYMLPL